MDFSKLDNFLIKKSVILCLGNDLRGDDAFGPKLANIILEKLSSIKVINAGTVPENYIHDVLKNTPCNVLIIDAAEFKAPPGQIEIVEPKNIKNFSISTHNASIKLTIDYLLSNGVKEVRCLFIKPKSLEIGQDLTDDVKKSLDKLSQYLIGKFYKKLN